MEALDVISRDIALYREGKHEVHPFYQFEPWDVEKRPDSVLEAARKDGIDLYSDMLMKHVGRDPHPFQTGYLMSDSFMRCLIAGSQVGKSYVALMEAIMMLTGELPVALRHELGEDTGVKRAINEANIRRFGRFDSRTGTFIDNKQAAPSAESWNEWDCGNIIGVGIYPSDKIAPEGDKVWIGTHMKAMTEYWWPRMYGAKILIPPHLIDRDRGKDGYSQKNNTVYLTRGTSIPFITYDSGYEKFEAEMVHRCLLDEEPQDPRIVQSAQQHARGISLIETPYRGMTWSKDLVYPQEPSPDKVVFHATQYDSPYQTAKRIATLRKNMPEWEIGARIWGMHSEATGKPYFDRTKINAWANRFTPKYSWQTFEPNRPFFGITKQVIETPTPMLSEVGIRLVNLVGDNSTTSWRIYELGVQEMSPYVLTADPAEGGEEPGEEADSASAMITRPWMLGEQTDDNRPFKIVATLRSTMKPQPFSLCCVFAAMHYNNALIAAETRRHASNATFFNEIADYAYWYTHTSLNDKTQRMRQHKGFDTNAATRPAIFELIRGWLDSAEIHEYPEIPDGPLLKELAACVVGKKGRPDHTKRSTLDITLCMGIQLFVYKNARNQIVCNRKDPNEGIAPFSKLMKRFGIDEQPAPTAKGYGEDITDWRS